jgi:hypothetical protein
MTLTATAIVNRKPKLPEGGGQPAMDGERTATLNSDARHTKEKLNNANAQDVTRRRWLTIADIGKPIAAVRRATTEARTNTAKPWAAPESSSAGQAGDAHSHSAQAMNTAGSRATAIAVINDALTAAVGGWMADGLSRITFRLWRAGGSAQR